jgi:hypothetical protein
MGDAHKDPGMVGEEAPVPSATNRALYY